eukprot:Phypoly_transcript_04194.p1 GENE.Phypoly_transcript_04194~~Phypoly_transcript_04194.p1  ORF type:complete len:703 (+),score=65.28 Phypoly_transcript_04194:42-2111(+)
MKVVGLVSGGKDSCFNLMQCMKYGHEIVVLANLRPSGSYDELDSYMYQTVGYQLISALAECLTLPLVQRCITGAPKLQSMSYVATEQDEVEDLFLLLQEVKTKFPEVGAVSCGAILSNYQRLRVESVCSRLGLVSLAYLWHQDQMELLQSMVSETYDIHAILVKVASYGLTPEKHLGKPIKQLFPELVRLSKQYELNVCGEGGEYESFVLDCPLFKKRIVIDQTETIIHSNDAFATVAFLRIQKWHLEDKPTENSLKFLPSPSIPPSIPTSSPSPPVNKEITWVFPENSKNNQTSDGTQTTSDTQTTTNKISVVANQLGDFVYLSGTSKQSEKVSEQQLLDLFVLVKDELSKMKLGMECLSFINVYVNSMDDFVRINQEYYKHFGVNPPSRACIQPYHTQDENWITIDCVGSTLPRAVLHVQSISKWAPACIGPYSQAVTIDQSTIFSSGQIGLDPPYMQIIHGGYEVELSQVLFNIQQVLLEVSSHITYCTTLTVFVLESDWISKIAASISRYLEEKLGEHDAQIVPIISYVQVAALPRKAQVEVVVTSLSKTCDFEVYLSLPCTASELSDGFITETKGLICQEIRQGYVNFLQLKIGTSLSALDPQKFSTCVAQSTQDLTRTHAPNQTTVAVRLYYSQHLIPPTVLNVLACTMAKYGIRLVTFVPVLEMRFERRSDTRCLVCLDLTW